MTKKHTKKPTVHTEVSDSSLSDEESMSFIKRSTKTSKVVACNWPWFLGITSSDEAALKKLSHFAIQKGLVGLARQPKHVTKLNNGSLLVEGLIEKHSLKPMFQSKCRHMS